MRLTFSPNRCTFGFNRVFVKEASYIAGDWCKRKSIVDLHKRIFYLADFGCFFVIKSLFEKRGQK